MCARQMRPAPQLVKKNLCPFFSSSLRLAIVLIVAFAAALAAVAILTFAVLAFSMFLPLSFTRLLLFYVSLSLCLSLPLPFAFAGAVSFAAVWLAEALGLGGAKPPPSARLCQRTLPAGSPLWAAQRARRSMRGVLDLPVSELAHPESTSPVRLGRLLGKLAWPSRALCAAPASRAATGARPRLQLGMAISRSTGPCISRDSAARPVLTRLVANFVFHCVPGFPFCSLALAHSSEAGAHEDPNVGLSAVAALGQFTGGRLWTYDVASDRIRAHAVKRKFVLFNAREPHGTESFRGGPRYTITAYIHVRAHMARPSVCSELTRLGFRLPLGGLAQALPGSATGTRAHRLSMARVAWRRYCGRSGRQKAVTQRGRKPGEHRAAVWVCACCGRSGVQHSGRPRRICTREACRLQRQRARRRGVNA